MLADSFARIYFRNSINNGVPALVVDTSQIEEGDEIEVDLEGGTVKDLTKGIELETKPLPKVMLDILSEGGLIDYVKKHGGLTV